jgi:carbonic anhydrase
MKARLVHALLFTLCLAACEGLTYTSPGSKETQPLTSWKQVVGMPAPEQPPASAKTTQAAPPPTPVAPVAAAPAAQATPPASAAPAPAAAPPVTTPQAALQRLKDGNARAFGSQRARHDLVQEARRAAELQQPFASVLTCSDSQAAPELVFDQGLGDLYTVRVAGNVVNDNVVGSLEYAAAHLGSRLILVLGHTQCDAIKGACDNTRLGSFTSIVEQLSPAIVQVPTSLGPRNSRNAAFVQVVADLNVRQAMKQIREKSAVLREMIDKGQIELAGAMLDSQTGRVTFF